MTTHHPSCADNGGCSECADEPQLRCEYCDKVVDADEFVQGDNGPFCNRSCALAYEAEEILVGGYSGHVYAQYACACEVTRDWKPLYPWSVNK